MRDLLAWNLKVGRLAGVRIRFHALFLVLALLALVAAGREQRADALAHYGVFFAVLTSSVLLHELGHCRLARGLGGRIDEIVLWPLGGLTRPLVPPGPLRECGVALAGPAVNLLLAAAAALVLWLSGQDVLAAADPTRQVIALPSWIGAVETVLWTNLWVLLAVNLLPAEPLDGGAAVRSLLTHALGAERGAQAALRVAQLTGIGLCLLAWWIPAGGAWEYVWLPLLLLGIFLFCSAGFASPPPKARIRESEAGYDLLHGAPGRAPVVEDDDLAELDTDTETVDPYPAEPRIAAPPADLRAIHREEQLQQKRKLEEDEDRRVDEILARLHQAGMGALSADDRALLQRASARYRQRQHND